MNSALERAVDRGEIGEADLARSDQLLTAVLGIMVIDATSADPEDARCSVECLRAEIRGWTVEVSR